MRFLCVNQPARADIFGEIFQLKPFDPHLENYEDILASDHFSAAELLQKHREVLLEVAINTERFKNFPRPLNRLSDLKSNGRVLILRNGGIGDHILLLPALRIFREQFPGGTEMHLAVQKEKQAVYHKNPYIDRLMAFPVRLTDLLQFDYFIDFSARDDWYDHDRRHMTDSYLHFLGIDYSRVKLDPPRMAWNPKHCPSLGAFFDRSRKLYPHKPLVLLNWSASNRLRDLPPEKLLFLIPEFRHVLFVLAQEKSYAGKAEERLRPFADRSQVLDCSAYMASLDDYINAIALCDAVVSTDTAAAHLAEALDKPSLVLYGPTRDELWIRDYRKTVALRAGFIGRTCCSPCGLIKNIKTGCPEAVLQDTAYSPCLLSFTETIIRKSFIAFMNLHFKDTRTT